MRSAVALLVLVIGFQHAHACDINLSTWMTDMWSTIGYKSLASVWLPGSHDSGTFDLGNQSYEDSCDQGWFSIASDILPEKWDLIKKLSNAQLRGLADQAMNAGIRYFDLRLYPVGSEAYFVHCLLSKAPFQDYLAELANSIKALPESKEVYVLDFYAFAGSWSTEQHQAVINKVVALFDGNIATGMNASTPLKKIVGTGGPKVILLWSKNFAGMDNAEYLTSQSEWLQRPYDGVNTQKALLERNAGYYTQYASVIKGNSKLFVMESVMTAEGGDIAGLAADVIKFGGDVTSELIKWQGNLNWAVVEYMYGNWVGAGKPGMVIMMDDVRATYGADIVKANMPVPPAPVMWSFGSCSASYNWWTLSCDGSDARGCAPGYTDRNFYAGTICYCKCCLGNDCGCGTESQDACA